MHGLGMSETECPVVVLDNGTGVLKAGFCSDRAPRCTIPSVVGRTRRQRAGVNSGAREMIQEAPCLGSQAWALNQELELSYPCSNGVVKSWPDIKLIWDSAFSSLGVTPADSKIMLTDPALSPIQHKQTMVEVMLEEYGFQAVSMQVQAVLSLYAHGLDTGVVLDSGDGVSHAVAVVHGFALSHVTQRLEVAGRHITEHLMELLLRRGATLNRVHDLDWVRRIKEASCYVATDLHRERRLYRETTCMDKSYTLPDGRVIKVGVERYQAPEVLFTPGLIDKDQGGVAHMLHKTINECDLDNRRELYCHIVISGGSSMFPGLPARLEHELRQLYTTHVLEGDHTRQAGLKTCVYDNPDRQNMVFKGAAVFAKLVQHQPECWVTLDQWEEEGPHRCLKRLGVLAV